MYGQEKEVFLCALEEKKYLCGEKTELVKN